jgi:hypothetical protein
MKTISLHANSVANVILTVLIIVIMTIVVIQPNGNTSEPTTIATPIAVNNQAELR